MGKFAEFVNRTFFEEGGITSIPEESNLTLEEREKLEKFEVSVSETDVDVVSEAQRIITDSQVEFDEDEYPDISNVQTVLDTTGAEADHNLVQGILKNFAHCEPEGLLKDGLGRKSAILSAIESVKQGAENLKLEKAKDEEDLAQAERDAESECTEAINQANAQSEREIEEEKKRSAQIIAEIRQRAEEATAQAKETRKETLERISGMRTENENVLRRSSELVAETEKYGNQIVSQIDIWLSYLN